MPNDPLEEARALLAQGNILGEQASQLTGIAFTPTTFTAPPPTTPLTQPTVLSSQAGADLFRQAQTDVSDLEKKVSGGITIPQGATLSGLAQQHGTTVQELMRLNPQITDPNRIMAGATLNVPQIIRPLGEPATDAMIQDINRVASGGQLTAAQARALTGVQNIQDDLTAAAAAARAALERRDFNALEQARERAQANIQRLRETTEQLFKDLAPLRQRRLDLMAPSERERELRGQLNEIRQKAEEFRLQTEQEKFSEFEGQTMGFAAGRAREIDIRASFKLQEMALKERNILMELGMEQEARQLESKTVEQQISDLSEDFNLREKVEDRISKLEQDVVDKAARIPLEAQSALGDLVDNLSGFSWNDLNSELQGRLQEYAQVSGISIDLVKDALIAEKARRAHDETLRKSQIQNFARAVESGALRLENVPADFRPEVTRRVDLSRIPVSAVPTGIDRDIGLRNLAAVGLAPNVIGTDNKLTRVNADKVVAAGVPRETLEAITEDILAGRTLDQIRNDLAEVYGRDTGFGYLDTYMSTLQGVKSGTGAIDALVESAIQEALKIR